MMANGSRLIGSVKGVALGASHALRNEDFREGEAAAVNLGTQQSAECMAEPPNRHESLGGHVEGFNGCRRRMVWLDVRGIRDERRMYVRRTSSRAGFQDVLSIWSSCMGRVS